MVDDAVSSGVDFVQRAKCTPYCVSFKEDGNCSQIKGCGYDAEAAEGEGPRYEGGAGAIGLGLALMLVGGLVGVGLFM